MGVYQRGKSYYIDVRDGKGRRIRKSVGRLKAVAQLVEKDLLVKIARREYLGIFETDATPFSSYASAWLEMKKATVARSTYGDYRSTWNRYVLPHFGNMPLCRVTRLDVEEFLGKLAELSGKRKNNIMVPLRCLFNDARRRGDIKEPPTGDIRRFKEEKPFIDPLSFPMLDPLFEALWKHRQEAPAGSAYVFSGKAGRPLDVNNLRNRVWYPVIAAAGLRRRTMYQTRHTFASLMLSHGEDPLWVARMLGHTGLNMIFRHYGKFIRNRARKDGGKFLEGLKEAEACPVMGLTSESTPN